MAKKLLAALLLLGTIASAMQDNNDTEIASSSPQNHVPEIMAYCSSLKEGTKPIRESLLRGINDTKKRFFSSNFVAKVIRKSHTREFDHSGDVYSVVFDPLGEHLATGCFDGKARIFNISRGECTSEFDHNKWVYSMVFDPSGKHLATGCNDKKARIFNISRGECTREFDHSGDVYSVTFDPSGEHLATGCDDKKARIFNISGECVSKFDHNKWVRSVAFDPSGKYLAIGCTDGKAQIFNISRGECVREFNHNGCVFSVAFDPSGERLATGCSDKKARIFDIARNACVSRLPHDGSVYSVAFDPSGEHLATGCFDQKARIFKLAIITQIQDMLALPENMEQLELLQACEIAMKSKEYVHVTDKQLETFQTLPERMQNTLRIYIVTPEQYTRITKGNINKKRTKKTAGHSSAAQQHSLGNEFGSVN